MVKLYISQCSQGALSPGSSVTGVAASQSPLQLGALPLPKPPTWSSGRQAGSGGRQADLGIVEGLR